MGRALIRKIEGTVGVAVAGLVVCLLVVFPLAHVVLELRPASFAVLNGDAWRLFARSLALAGATTALAVLLGVPLGACFARARMRSRPFLGILHALPLLLPPLFTALGWFQWVGVDGIAGSAATSALLFSPIGVVFTLALALSPAVTLLTMLGIAGLDPSLEEAGLVAARPGRVLFRLLVPAARPSIMLGACVVFALALAEVSVPMFLRVRVYASNVFTRLGGIDFAPGEAAVLGLPLLGAGLLLSYAARRPAASLRIRGYRDEPLELGVWPTVIASAFALIGAAPLVGLVLRARPRLADAWDWLGHSHWNTVVVSIGAAVASGPLALLLGHARARGSRLARAFEEVASSGFFVPSAVLGVGVIRAWNRPATSLVYGSIAIVIIALSGRYAALAIKAFGVSVASTGTAYEDAAAVLGAGATRRLVRIVLPMHRRGMLGAIGLTALFAARDVETSALLYSPGGEPLTVRILTLEPNAPSSVVAALALAQAAITLLLLATFVLPMRRLA
jgi:iron(III) transport system permease protein